MPGRGVRDCLGLGGRWSICGGHGRNTRWWISRSEGGKGGSVQIIGRCMVSNIAWLTFVYGRYNDGASGEDDGTQGHVGSSSRGWR